VSPVAFADWPVFRHDDRRSGVSDEPLLVDHLEEVWRWRSPRPPAPAWPDAARWDAYAMLEGLRSMRNYDPVFHPVGTGDRLYFGSNADDTVRCLNLDSGDPVWSFTADGPIRISPSIAEGMLLFTADDGAVYALNRQDGALIWKTPLTPDAECFFNDGRLCSFDAARTGVVVDRVNEVAVAGSGVFPWRSSRLTALSLRDGSVVWQRDIGTGWSLEGAMLLSDRYLVVPQGRAAPQLFDRQTGEPRGGLEGGGGTFALVTPDEEVFHGPGETGPL
jgi:outer membrane protein assembly factor BamB